jgi:hypothetical protein
MKRIVRLTESDLVKLVKRVVREQSEQEMMNATPVNMTAVGMDPKKAMEILAQNGFLWILQKIFVPVHGSTCRSNPRANLVCVVGAIMVVVSPYVINIP